MKIKDTTMSKVGSERGEEAQQQQCENVYNS